MTSQSAHPMHEELLRHRAWSSRLARMTMREGAEAIGIQRRDRAVAATQYALLQSVPPAPGRQPVIRVFPACPATWYADFTLAARGGFLVTSSRRAGEVGFVELKSRAGGPCRLPNPWPDTTVSLHRDGSKADELAGELLQFETTRNETVILAPAGESLSSLRRSVPAVPAASSSQSQSSRH